MSIFLTSKGPPVGGPQKIRKKLLAIDFDDQIIVILIITILEQKEGRLAGLLDQREPCPLPLLAR